MHTPLVAGESTGNLEEESKKGWMERIRVQERKGNIEIFPWKKEKRRE